MSDDKKLQAQPKPPSPAIAADLQAVVEQQARDIAELRQLLMLTIQSQPKISPDTLWAKQHEKEMAIKADLDAKAALFEQTTTQRTQWEANKLNPDGKRLFEVCVGWCPKIVIRANDDTMAKAYYDKVCGIRGVQSNSAKPEKTTYSIVDVTDKPEAQKTVKGIWEYKPATVNAA